MDQTLSPLFDRSRDSRYGRVEECYGEDPYLVRKMGVAFVLEPGEFEIYAGSSSEDIRLRGNFEL